MHPILYSLDGTRHEWIKKLLFTFNEGNIGKFEAQSPLFGQEVRHHPLEAGSRDLRDMRGDLSQYCWETIRSCGRRSASWH
jgi:hypothetical protein